MARHVRVRSEVVPVTPCPIHRQSVMLPPVGQPSYTQAQTDTTKLGISCLEGPHLVCTPFAES